jgi:hypothetical protein
MSEKFGKKNYITSKRCLFGSFDWPSQVETTVPVTIHLKDLYGWVNTGLNDLFFVANIPNSSKNDEDMNKMKSCMEKCFSDQSLTKKLILYSLGDVYFLAKVRSKIVEKMNGLLGKLEISTKYFFRKDEIPGTTGSLTEAFLKKFIDNKLDKQNLLERFEKVNEKVGVPSMFHGFSKKKKEKISDLLSGCSIQSLASLYLHNSGLLNIVNSGGRAYNEKPFFNAGYVGTVADVDIAGCYGNALREFDIPLGIPKVHAFTEQQELPTLGEFLKTHETNFVENMYTIIISGELSFHQNLLYSKIVDYKQLGKKINQILNDDYSVDPEDVQDKSGKFVIFEKQLENTILTSDLLEGLKKICSSRELKEIMDCKVVTAVVYQKSEYIEDLKTFVEKMESSYEDNKVYYGYSEETNQNFDTRPRFWTKIKLSEFMNPLIEERSVLKKQMKEESKKEKPNLNTILECDANQRCIKLIINSVYGVLSSPFFEISNCVLSKVITARARLHIWMISRAVSGFQSITDGCTYQPSKVLKLNSSVRKPGLSALSKLSKLSENRNISEVSLGNVNWEEVYSEKDWPKIYDLDKLLTDHIHDFYQFYNFKFPYTLEHKFEHASKKLFYIKKCDYALETLDEKQIEIEKNKKN